MYGVVTAAADVKVTHAPCEGGVVAGRPTHVFPATLAAFGLGHECGLWLKLLTRALPWADTFLVSGQRGKVGHVVHP